MNKRIKENGAQSPNDPKLSDGRGWRDRWVVGERRRQEAAGVTAAPVRGMKDKEGVICESAGEEREALAQSQFQSKPPDENIPTPPQDRRHPVRSAEKGVRRIFLQIVDD